MKIENLKAFMGQLVDKMNKCENPIEYIRLDAQCTVVDQIIRTEAYDQDLEAKHEEALKTAREVKKEEKN